MEKTQSIREVEVTKSEIIIDKDDMVNFTQGNVDIQCEENANMLFLCDTIGRA